MKITKRLDKPLAFRFSDLLIDKASEVPVENTSELRWIVEGYCAVAENVDQQGDRIEKKALQGAVEYLKQYQTVLFNHDPDRPIGKILDAEIQGPKIWVRVQISKSEGDVWEKITEGIISRFSISGEIEDFAMEYDKELKSQIRVIKSFKIHEVSLVSVPANPEAKTLVAYMAKALAEAGYKGEANPGDEAASLRKFVDFLRIIMEVTKAMDWKAKITQAIKSLGDVTAKVNDESIQSALKEIQKLLTDAVSEIPQNYPEANKDLESKVGGLEKRLSDVETSINTKIGDFEKRFNDLDEALGGLSLLLKSMIDEENPGGGSDGDKGGGAE
jgi:HK97 family phage prohead protease